MSHLLRLCAAVWLLGASLAAGLYSRPITPAMALAVGNRIPWQGGSWYLQGANIPWYNWGCDFGCNANGGVSSAAVQSAVGAKLSDVKTSGTHTIRWWVFEGSAWQITTDSSGAPTGINPAVYADFDAALQLAQTYDVYYDFVLFSGPTAIPTSWETDATQRAKLAAALGTLFAHYRGNPRVLSWEVFNEPEWDIWNNKIAQAPVQATVKAVADAVHANSTAYVTVGSATLDGLGIWVGQGLDYYEAHWYDNFTGTACARCTDYPTVQARFGLDGPLVIGEMYAGPDVDSQQRFIDLYNKQYAGAWPWSLFPDRTSDHLAIDLSAVQSFTSQHTAIGPQAGMPTPTRTPTAAPSSTFTPSPAPTVSGGFTSGGYTTSATAPSSAAAGSVVGITAYVTSAAASTVLVDVEIYDPSGAKIYQVWFDNQAFAAGQQRSYSVPWNVPAGEAIGTHTVRVGVFSPGWGVNYHWNPNAAQFAVTAPSAATSTPTSTPTRTATLAPTLAPTATPTTATAGRVGDSTVEPSPDSDAAGTAEAFQYTASVSGAVTKLSLYLDGGSAAGKVVVGLYSHNAGTNSPGTLLTQGTISVPVNGAWNTVPVSSVSITAGTSYWIAVLSPAGSGTIQVRDQASTTNGSQTSSQTALTALPGAWSTGASWPTVSMSAYAS